MKRIISMFLCLVLLLGTFSAAAVAAEQSDVGILEVQIPLQYRQSEARKVFDKINVFRTGADAWYWNETDTAKVQVTGLQPLAYDYELEQVAMQRAAELVFQFSHDRPDQSSCFTAYGNRLSAAAENIAFGQTSAAMVHDAWREDEEPYDGQGHRRNMLSDDLSAVGIGCVEYRGRLYWAEAFRSPVSNLAKTDPVDTEKTVSVKVASDALTLFTLRSNCESLELREGERVSLPTAELLLSMRDGLSTVTATAAVTWESSNTAVAKVDAHELLAVKAGTCVLRASAYGQSLEISVTVIASPDQPVTEPVTEPTAEPPTEPSTEPSAEPSTEPTTESVTHVHQPEVLPPVTPTCVTTGLTTGAICSICGEMLTAQKIIPKTAHTFQTKLTKAKYHKAGQFVQTCTVCGLRKSKTIARIETIVLSQKSYVYDGSRHTPKVVVRDEAGKVLKRNTDYTLTYATGRKKVGTYTIKVQFTGNYSGSKTLKYKIVPGKVTNLKAKPASKSAVLSWPAVPGATHYAVYYSQKKKSGYQKLGTTAKTKATMLQLKSGTTYYFRVRAVTIRGDAQWNGALSSPIRVIAK